MEEEERRKELILIEHLLWAGLLGVLNFTLPSNLPTPLSGRFCIHFTNEEN